jgi:YHS domain-containing protein
MMKRRFVALFIFAAFAGLLACNSQKKEIAKTEQKELPEVIVCSMDSTGSVLLTPDDSIPKLEYNGKVYYFSSRECRDAVMKDPAKYLGEETQAKSK